MILAMSVTHAVGRGQQEHELLRLIAAENDLSNRSDRDRIDLDDLLGALARLESNSCVSAR